MATYVLSSTNSDLSGGADFSKALVTSGAGTAGISFSVAAGTTEVSYAFTPSGVPGTAGINGTYTVEVNITTGSNVGQLAIQIHRINSSGTVQASSTTTAEQAATAGVKTFSVDGSGLGTWASGDRLRVDYIWRGTHAMNAASLGIATGDANSEVREPVSLSTVTEDFEAGGSLENAKWNVYVDGTGTVTATGGEGVLTPEQLNAYSAILYSDANYGQFQLDATGVYVKLTKRLTTANTAAGGVTEFRVYDWSGGQTNTFLNFEVSTAGVLTAYTVNAGTVSNSQQISTTWDSDNTPWLKISISGGTATWWTAPDSGGTPGTWTSRHTNSSLPSTFANALIWLQAYNNDWTTTGALTDAAKFDGLNTAANVSTTAVGADLSGAYGVVAAVGENLAGNYAIITTAGQDRTGAYAIVNAAGQDQAGSYAIVSAAGADLSGAYGVDGPVGSDHAGAYAIVEAVGQDQGGSYTVLNTAGEDLAGAYGIVNAVNADQAGSYAIVNAVGADRTGAYAIAEAAGADLADAYGVIAAVGADLAGAYAIEATGAVGADLAGTYAIASAVSADHAGAYSLREAVGQDGAGAYAIAAAVGQNQSGAYAIATTAGQNLAGAYTIESTGAVGADLAGSYAITATVTSDSAGQYVVLATVSANLDGAYQVLGSGAAVGSDLAQTYAIAAAVASEMAGQYAVQSDIRYGARSGVMVQTADRMPAQQTTGRTWQLQKSSRPPRIQ